jgi:hypothetical protein
MTLPQATISHNRTESIIAIVFVSVLMQGCASKAPQTNEFQVVPHVGTGLVENSPPNSESTIHNVINLNRYNCFGPENAHTEKLKTISFSVPPGWKIARMPKNLAHAALNHYQNYFMLNRTGNFNDLSEVIVIHPRSMPVENRPLTSTKRLVEWRSPIFDFYPGTYRIRTKKVGCGQVRGMQIGIYDRLGDGPYFQGWGQRVTGVVLSDYAAIGFFLGKQGHPPTPEGIKAFESVVATLNWKD